VSQPAFKDVWDAFEAVLGEHPGLRLQLGSDSTDPDADPQVWPVYVYGRSEHARTIWQRLAAHANVRFIGHLPDPDLLEHVNASLNEGSSRALESGVIWIRQEDAFTPRARRIGVTYHPLKANAQVMLMLPEDWDDLFDLVFPFPERTGFDGEYRGTHTTDSDEATYSQMTPKMKRVVLRENRGIESGVPAETPLNPEAFAMLDSSFMRTYHIIPFRVDEDHGKLMLFMANVEDQEVQDQIYRITRLTVVPVFMEAEDEASFWAQYDETNRAEALRTKLTAEG